MIRRGVGILLAAGLMSCAATSRDSPSMHGSPARAAELVVLDATVITMNPGCSEAEAFAISSGRFRVIGSNAQVRPFIGPATRVVDAEGATIVPGLIDAHLHLFGEGFRRMGLDLVGTGSKAEVLERVRQAAATALPGTWLRGRGWDQNDWPDSVLPGAADLDTVVADRPVVLSRIDGHAIWVNSRALELAGIDALTADPLGGRIERLGDGRPSGILVDNAESLIWTVVPPHSREEKAEAARIAAQAAVAAGLTGIHEPGLDGEDVAILEELYRRGEIPLRIYVMLSPGPALERYLEAGPEVGLFGHRLTVRAVKLYADGALGSRGAALLEDYCDDPGNDGLLTTSPDELEKTIRRAALAGLQPCVHAIGDRANHLVLDIYERLRSDGLGGDLRPRIEHAQVLAPDDIERFARLGVIASMQPTHCTSDMPWAEDRLGSERLTGAYAWRSLLDAGARLAFGSDAPVESFSPTWGLYSAVTRQDHEGRPEGGWQAQEAIGIEDALRAYTVDAAYAANEERLKGSIQPGRLADFVILDRDPRVTPAAELLDLRVLATYVGGEAVYQAAQAGGDGR